MSVPITPETRVGALLEAYPGIEEVLIGIAPAFSKLKNPILRRTVAKVATLEQAAKIGGIGVREMVRRLREATGQSLESLPAGSEPHSDPAGEVPPWVDERRVAVSIDAETLLKTGEHPMGRIRQALATSRAGDLIRLTSTFYPAPLIDALAKSGCMVFSSEPEPGRHVTYFSHAPPRPDQT